jgi:hypothetical protein
MRWAELILIPCMIRQSRVLKNSIKHIISLSECSVGTERNIFTSLAKSKLVGEMDGKILTGPRNNALHSKGGKRKHGRRILLSLVRKSRREEGWTLPKVYYFNLDSSYSKKKD